MLEKIMTYLKRATGIGYYSYPPLEQQIDHKQAADMERKSRTLCEEVDYIERLLSRQDSRRRNGNH
jgi:hypothetical protein